MRLFTAATGGANSGHRHPAEHNERRRRYQPSAGPVLNGVQGRALWGVAGIGEHAAGGSQKRDKSQSRCFHDILH